jgi:hypothetical protein
MDAAVAWMLRGESASPPIVSEDVKAEPTPVKQPEDARLRTERALVEAIAVGASKSMNRV